MLILARCDGAGGVAVDGVGGVVVDGVRGGAATCACCRCS